MKSRLERVKGIEPSSQAWEARILPLNHTRFRCASARQARTGTDNVYQTGKRLATGLQNRLQNRQDSMTSCLMASRNRSSIKSWRSGGHHLASVRFAHVKTVNRRAAFGDDARGGNIQIELGEHPRNGVEQAQAVFGLNFDERARIGNFIVEMNLRRNPLAGISLINRPRNDLPGNERGQIHSFVVQHLVEQAVKFVVLLARGEVAGLGVVDEKFVEHDCRRCA